MKRRQILCRVWSIAKQYRTKDAWSKSFKAFSVWSRATHLLRFMELKTHAVSELMSVSTTLKENTLSGRAFYALANHAKEKRLARKQWQHFGALLTSNRLKDTATIIRGMVRNARLVIRCVIRPLLRVPIRHKSDAFRTWWEFVLRKRVLDQSRLLFAREQDLARKEREKKCVDGPGTQTSAAIFDTTKIASGVAYHIRKRSPFRLTLFESRIYDVILEKVAASLGVAARRRRFHGQARRLFQMWSDLVEIRARAKKTVTRCIDRLLSHGIAGAFEKWGIHTKLRRRHEDELRRRVGMAFRFQALQEQQLFQMSFQQWHVTAVKQRAVKTRCFKTIEKGFRRVVAGAMSKWKRYAWSQHARSRSAWVIFNVLTRMRRGYLRSAMTNWRRVMKSDEDHKERVAHIVKRMLLLRVASAFDAWRATSRFRRMSRIRIQSVQRAFLARLDVNTVKHIQRAWQRWADFVHCDRLEASTTARKRSSVRALMNRLKADREASQRHAVMRAFARWHREAEHHSVLIARVRRVMARSLGTRVLSSLACAFGLMKSNMIMERYQQHSCESGAKILMRLRQRFVLHAWRRVASMQIKQRFWVKRRNDRLSLRAKRQTLGAWRALTGHVTVLREAQIGWFHKRRGVIVQYFAFAALRRHHCDVLTERLKMNTLTIEGLHKKFKVSKSFAKWKLAETHDSFAVERHRVTKDIRIAIMRRRQRRQLHEVFDAWAFWAAAATNSVVYRARCQNPRSQNKFRRMWLLREPCRRGKDVPTAAWVRAHAMRNFGRLIQRCRFTALQSAWIAWLRGAAFTAVSLTKIVGPLGRRSVRLAARLLTTRLFARWKRNTRDRKQISHWMMHLRARRELHVLAWSYRQWVERMWSRRLQTRDALHRLLVARLARESERTKELEESLETERLQAEHVQSEHRFRHNSLMQEVKELRSEMSWSARKLARREEALSPGGE